MSAPLKKSIWVSFVAYTLEWFSAGIVFPHFAYFLFHKEFHFVPEAESDAIRGVWLGTLFAIPSVMQFIASPILGLLSDEKGRRALLLISFVFIVLGTAIANFGVMTSSLLLLVLSRVFVGIGAGNIAVFTASIIDVSSQEQYAKRFGLFNAFRNVGYAAGMLASGIFAGRMVQEPFVIATISSTVCLILLFFNFEETLLIRKKVTIYLKNLWGDLKNGFQIADVNKLLLIMFIFYSGWSCYWDYMPVTWMKILGLSFSQVGTFYAYGIAINALSSAIFIRPVFNRFKSETVLVYSLFSLAVFMLLLLFFMSQTALWWLIPIEQFLISLIIPASMTIVATLAKNKTRGVAMGGYNSVKGLALVFTPASGIFLAISFKMPIILAGGFVLIAGVIFGLLLMKRRYNQ